MFRFAAPYPHAALYGAANHSIAISAPYAVPVIPAQAGIDPG